MNETLKQAEADRDANAKSRRFHIERADNWRKRYFEVCELLATLKDAAQEAQPLLEELRARATKDEYGPSLELVNAQVALDCAVEEVHKKFNQ